MDRALNDKLDAVLVAMRNLDQVCLKTLGRLRVIIAMLGGEAMLFPFHLAEADPEKSWQGYSR